MFPCTTIFDTNNTPTPVISVSAIFEVLFFSTRRIILDHFKCRNSFFKGFFFFVSRFDIYARFSHWLDVITSGYCISIQSCRWTYERTALPYSIPDCRFSISRNCRRRSHCGFLQTSILGYHRVPRRSLVVLCTRSRQHGSAVANADAFATQHLMCICESSIQGSRFAIFIESLNLPPPTPSRSKFAKNVSTVAPVSRFAFTLAEIPSGNELTGVQHIHSLSSCHSTQLQSSVQSSKTPVVVPFSRAPFLMNQRHKPVPYELIPDFPNLFLISSFQDLRYRFSVFYRCLSLWKLGSHLGFLWTSLWIFHCSLYPFLCL